MYTNLKQQERKAEMEGNELERKRLKDLADIIHKQETLKQGAAKIEETHRANIAQEGTAAEKNKIQEQHFKDLGAHYKALEDAAKAGHVKVVQGIDPKTGQEGNVFTDAQGNRVGFVPGVADKPTIHSLPTGPGGEKTTYVMQRDRSTGNFKFTPIAHGGEATPETRYKDLSTIMKTERSNLATKYKMTSENKAEELASALSGKSDPASIILALQKTGSQLPPADAIKFKAEWDQLKAQEQQIRQGIAAKDPNAFNRLGQSFAPAPMGGAF
jgi:hypothetical protein